MNITIEKYKNNLVVELKGELDHHNTENSREKIDQQYSDHRMKNIVFDLRGLTFMDSSGIGLIMGRYKKSIEKGGKIGIISENSYVDKILKISGLLKIVTIYPTIESAIESL